LIDFGVSKLFEGTVSATTLVGTPAYMSPEIANDEGEKKYDPFQSDGK
jgi:serine/threonine protein kinase